MTSMVMLLRFGELMVVSIDCKSILLFVCLLTNSVFRDLARMFTIISKVFQKNNLELHIAVPPPLYSGYVL